MSEYLGDIAGPAENGRASGLGAVLSAVSAISVDVGRLRATVEHLSGEQAATAAHLGRLTGLPRLVEQLQRQAAEAEQLAEEVARLAQAVEDLADSEPAEPPLRPVDWAHVPLEERGAWLADLVAWVRDVVFVGWPPAAERLRGCWPRHLDLVNDVAMLRTLYQAAYERSSGRAHHAVEFRRMLEEVLRTADAHTRECPGPGEARPHLVPLPARDDTDQLRQAERVGVLGEVYRLTEQANHLATPPDLRAAATERASRLFSEHRITQAEYLAYEQALTASRAAADTTRRPAGGPSV
ncbi:hypothetical protein HS048_36410 [Planomonospora sp. ID91781]|uniref:hypothetical protein n=1 Tax=Planomonospora sp. ID91781 TaxID=2738135 RepID=UPI0018C36021|nr:hypothetical protein [Planomonospora sp. ID91781]MBG0826152.1 hypothetical protein [Planomonospora sp. ID91781]